MCSTGQKAEKPETIETIDLIVYIITHSYCPNINVSIFILMFDIYVWIKQRPKKKKPESLKSWVKMTNAV